MEPVSSMARLYRVVRLNDRQETEAFTFLLPKSLATDISQEVKSKDFTYGSHRWIVSFPRGDAKQLGTFLTLKNISAGMTVSVDVTFTMQNKEHFTKNEAYAEKDFVFKHDKPTNGRKNFIGLPELPMRGFHLDSGEFLMDIELRNIKTYFEQIIQLPPEHSKATQLGGPARHQKIETSYFTFGQMDWNVAVYPLGDSPQTDGRPLIYLVRQTSLNHLCRVRYKIIIGERDRTIESEIIEQVLNVSCGTAAPWECSYSFYQLTMNKGAGLRIRVELLSVSAMTEVRLMPFDRNKNKAHFYDRDNQAWMIEVDTNLPQLRFKLYYTDVRNVPRKHMRHIWNNIIVVPARGHYKPMKALGGPFSNYYAQVDVDAEGFEVLTEVSVKEIQNPASAILDQDGGIIAHIEWIDSHLLFNDKYNRFDEINSRHKYQMAREIKQLQTENYSLEKQLYSYQMSIAKVNSKGKLEDMGGVMGEAAVHAQAQAIAMADRTAQPMGQVNPKTQAMLAQVASNTPTGSGLPPGSIGTPVPGGMLPTPGMLPASPGGGQLAGVGGLGGPPQIVQPHHGDLPPDPSSKQPGVGVTTPHGGGAGVQRLGKDGRPLDRQPSSDRRTRDRSRDRSRDRRRAEKSGAYPAVDDKYVDPQGYLATEPQYSNNGADKYSDRYGDKYADRYGEAGSSRSGPSSRELDRHSSKYSNRYGSDKHLDRHGEKITSAERNSEKYGVSNERHGRSSYAASDPGYNYDDQYSGDYQYYSDKYGGDKYIEANGKYAEDKYYMGGNGSSAAYGDRYYDTAYPEGSGYSPEKYPGDEYSPEKYPSADAYATPAASTVPGAGQFSPDKYSAADDPYYQYGDKYSDDPYSVTGKSEAAYSSTSSRKASSSARDDYYSTSGGKVRGAGHKEQYSDDGYYSSQTDFSSTKSAAAAGHAAVSSDPYSKTSNSSGYGSEEKYPPSSRKHSSSTRSASGGAGRTSPYQEAYPDDAAYPPRREHSHKSRSRHRDSAHSSSSADKYYSR